MSLASALSALAGINVSGVVNNYATNDLPEIIHSHQRPALLVLPVETLADEQRWYGAERSTAFENYVLGDGSGSSVRYVVTHLLVVAPSEKHPGRQAWVPLLVELLDNYASAIAADADLGGTLIENTRYSIVPGVWTYGSVAYIGASIRHTMVVGVSS